MITPLLEKLILLDWATVRAYGAGASNSFRIPVPDASVTVLHSMLISGFAAVPANSTPGSDFEPENLEAIRRALQQCDIQLLLTDNNGGRLDPYIFRMPSSVVEPVEASGDYQILIGNPIVVDCFHKYKQDIIAEISYTGLIGISTAALPNTSPNKPIPTGYNGQVINEELSFTPTGTAYNPNASSFISVQQQRFQQDTPGFTMPNFSASALPENFGVRIYPIITFQLVDIQSNKLKELLGG